MRFGIALQTDKTPQQYIALARLIDTYGFDVVSAYNDLFYQPAIGPLLIMAPYLHHAAIGPAIANPYTVHPVELAGQIAVLDLLTNGRAYLGLGRGAWLDQLGLESPKPVTAVREAILLFKHLLAGQIEEFNGAVFHLAAGARLQFQPLRTEVPVVVGTWGQRMARVAGELADEVKIGASSNPAMAGHLRPAIDAGCVRSGRQLGAVGICVGTPTVVDVNAVAARSLARRIVSVYLPIVAGLDPTLDDPEWLSRIEKLAARGDYEQVAASTSDKMLARFVIAGDPADVIRQVERLAEAGVSRVEFGNPHGLDEAEGIRLLGDRVLPHFR